MDYKQVKVTVTGSTTAENAVYGALVTWALMKFNVRPLFVGAERQVWNSLVIDELELSKKVAELINKNDVSFAINDTDESLKLKADLEAANKKIAQLESQLAGFQALENKDNQSL